jgi:hypothetical protein
MVDATLVMAIRIMTSNQNAVLFATFDTKFGI